MQFMSRSDQAYPTEEKPMARIQLIVMRHLYLLLGYSPVDKLFHITPPRLRYVIVINYIEMWKKIQKISLIANISWNF